MMLHLWEQDGGLSGLWIYNTALFEASTLARMQDTFLTLLDDGLQRPEARVGELRLLSDAARQRLLVDFNRTQAPFPEARCVHQLF